MRAAPHCEDPVLHEPASGRSRKCVQGEIVPHDPVPKGRGRERERPIEREEERLGAPPPQGGGCLREQMYENEVMRYRGFSKFGTRTALQVLLASMDTRRFPGLLRS